MRYTVGLFKGQDLDSLIRYVMQELHNVEDTLSALEIPWVQFQIHHKPPDKVFKGLVLMADGVDWLPVAGAPTPALYLYNGTVWQRL